MNIVPVLAVLVPVLVGLSLVFLTHVFFLASLGQNFMALRLSFEKVDAILIPLTAVIARFLFEWVVLCLYFYSRFRQLKSSASLYREIFILLYTGYLELGIRRYVCPVLNIVDHARIEPF